MLLARGVVRCHLLKVNIRRYNIYFTDYTRLFSFCQLTFACFLVETMFLWYDTTGER